jgi:hypothetical protein
MRRQAREIWVQIVRQFEKSGKQQEEYAKERGIPVGTLRSWIYRLRREQEDQAPLLPVRVIRSPALPARYPDDDGAAIEAELGDGVRLRFPRATPPAVIAEVIGLLRAKC